MTFVQILISLVLSYLSLALLYQFVLALASYSNSPTKVSHSNRINTFLILVPAFKCDEVILHTAEKNLSLKFLYPHTAFDIQVIADQLKSSTIQKLKDLGVGVHQVSFDKSTKVKSLQSAIKANKRNYDGVIVLDADNTAHINMLYQANKYLNQGYNVIQGTRNAANKNSTFALFDGLSEKANTKILCQGANQLGLSSKLSGSAMVFGYNTFAKAIMNMNAIGGFDKELELYFTSHKIFIQYAEEIVVDDEKVADSEAFAKQRGRWLQAQYHFLRESFLPATKSLFKGNRDYFHKSLQLALPPRALSPIILLIGLTLSIFFSFSVGIIISTIGLALTLGTYLVVLKPSDLIHVFLKLLAGLPALAFSVIKSLSLMNKAKKEFLHTEHKVQWS